MNLSLANTVFNDTQFLLGAAKAIQFPDDSLMEIAFAGRSNVGKSSAINAITQRKKLARTSKTPGRTQQINFFSLGPCARLVDLPGYGFAKVPLSVKKEWQQTIYNYLSERENLRVLFLLMDIRHPFSDLDNMLIDWASKSNIATQVLLTKADKFKKGKINSVQLSVEKTLAQMPGNLAVEAFSTHSRLGVENVRHQIANWVHPDNQV